MPSNLKIQSLPKAIEHDRYRVFTGAAKTKKLRLYRPADGSAEHNIWGGILNKLRPKSEKHYVFMTLNLITLSPRYKLPCTLNKRSPKFGGTHIILMHYTYR